MPKMYSVPRSSSSFVHLVNPNPAPLTRVAIRNADNEHLHPYMLFQQHVNRAHRRHALMAGRELPSDGVLENAMRKRWVSINDGDEAAANNLKLRKRQRGGLAMGTAGIQSSSNALIGKPGETNSDKVFTPLAPGNSPSQTLRASLKRI